MTLIVDAGEVKSSRAKQPAQPENVSSALLQFELPPVTETANDFIRDEQAQEIPAELNEQDAAEQHRGTPDRRGNPYDPAVHAFPPEMTGKLGKWKRKPKAKQDADIAGGQMVNTAYRAEADKLARLYAQLHMLPFGAEGGLQDLNDLAPLVDDLERYFMETGHTTISPKLAVLLSAGLYSVGVCQRPSNAEKLKSWFGGIWQKMRAAIGLKPKRKMSPNRAGANGEDKATDKPHTVGNASTSAHGGF